MSIEGSVELPVATTEPPNTNDGSGSGTREESDSQTVIRIPIIKSKSCLHLYNGWNVYGEIFPWYQFRSISVSWRGIRVCTKLNVL